MAAESRPPEVTSFAHDLTAAFLSVIAAAAVSFLALFATGCATPAVQSRMVQRGDTLYIFTKDARDAEKLCVGLGADLTRYRARSFLEGGDHLRARIKGCYAPGVIVAPEGDAATLAHEEGHRDGRVNHW